MFIKDIINEDQEWFEKGKALAPAAAAGTGIMTKGERIGKCGDRVLASCTKCQFQKQEL